MPTPVTHRVRQLRLLLLILPIVILVAVAWLHEPAPVFDEACLVQEHGIVICATSDMTRLARSGRSVNSHPRYDLNGENGSALHWRAARNETVAFQLILRREDRHAAKSVTIQLSESTIQPALFAAHYHAVDDAGYSWGPSTAVLPYPASYPDALIPQQHVCGDTKTRLFDSLQLPSPGRNQSVWVDLYVPDSVEAGRHQLDILVSSIEGAQKVTTTLPVMLDVIDASLPHKPSIDAVGEVYRAYKLEGAGYDRTHPAWQSMSRCYQQLAHQHRMVFIERTPDAPTTPADWNAYIAAFGPVLSGELFSRENGYRGTGVDTPVSVWRTPWPQDYDVNVEDALTASQLNHYTELAATWAEVATAQGWHNSRFFAYVFDEVDGPADTPESDSHRRDYIKRVHTDMQHVQAAIDDGTAEVSASAVPVDLIWTSHSDPTTWSGDPDTTLVDRVRLWAPNAHAANPAFLKERIAHGERTWFYHSGHPAVGGHSINLPGTDMRSWGVIGARYGIQGQLMWAVNLGRDSLPFAEPSYKPDDDRVGNGVMVYPGNQLPKIGYAAAAGPVPSMRLKAWRRGLQDAELYFLAFERNPVEAQALIHKLVPRALQEAVAFGDTTPTWPEDEASWIDWRDELLLLLVRE